MYLVKPLSRDKGSGRYMYLLFSPTDCLGRKQQIHCVSTRPLVPGEGLYQIHGQSLNTHRGKHRSGGAQHEDFSDLFLGIALRWEKSRDPNRESLAI